MTQQMLLEGRVIDIDAIDFDAWNLDMIRVTPERENELYEASMKREMAWLAVERELYLAKTGARYQKRMKPFAPEIPGCVRWWYRRYTDGKCEVCKVAYAVVFHHKHYRTQRYEMPCDLVWACNSCHEHRLHPASFGWDRWNPEMCWPQAVTDALAWKVPDFMRELDAQSFRLHYNR